MIRLRDALEVTARPPIRTRSSVRTWSTPSPPRSAPSSRSTCAGAPSARPRWTACGPPRPVWAVRPRSSRRPTCARGVADVARTRQPARAIGVPPAPAPLADAAGPPPPCWRSSPPSAAWPSGRTTGPIRPSSSPRSCRTPPPRPSRCPARLGPCASSCPRRTTARCCSRTACPPPSGKDYDLVPRRRRDGAGGRVRPDDDGTVRQRLERGPEDLVGVTLEPEGGSKEPTLPMIAEGTI